MKFETLKELV